MSFDLTLIMHGDYLTDDYFLSLESLGWRAGYSVSGSETFQVCRKLAKWALPINNFVESSFKFSLENFIYNRLFLDIYFRKSMLDEMHWMMQIINLFKEFSYPSRYLIKFAPSKGSTSYTCI